MKKQSTSNTKTEIKWINFLHIYQPAWQDEWMVRKVTKESYEFIVHWLKKHQSFKVTMNISGTLIVHLAELGYEKLLNDIKTLVDRGQIELTGSSHYHAFLPELPANEISRQIMLQESALKKQFDITKPRGFWLPEMAYSPETGSIIKEHGYEWIILDPISTMDDVSDSRKKYIDRRTGLTVVFRDRQLSNAYPPEAIFKLLNKKKGNQVLITATDGELYGHFHEDWQDHLKQILESDQIHSLKVSNYVDEVSDITPIHLRSASWQTRSRQIKRNNPFSIWTNRSNPIHRKLWQLANTAIEHVTRLEKDPNYQWARNHLDRGLASCSWWWASEAKTSAFGPIAWSPDEILKGASELIRSIRSLERLPKKDKIKAEKIFTSLQETIWTIHWNKHGLSN